MSTMGNRFLHHALLCVLVFATACATSKRDPSYTQKIDRVLVVSLNEDYADTHLRPRFSRLVTGKLFLLLNKYKVQMHVASPDPKEADPDAEVRERIASYHPNQILYLGPTTIREGAPLSPYNSLRYSHSYQFRLAPIDLGNVVFAVKLIDVASNRTIWQDTMPFRFELDPDQVAVDLVYRLKRENLLPSAQ